jgi:MSHA pilin protein MshA
VEDTTINFQTGGYPKAEAATATAAGLGSSDYKAYVKGDAGNPVTTIGADELVVVPAGLSAASAAKCYVSYKAPASTPPTVTVTGTADDCN